MESEFTQEEIDLIAKLLDELAYGFWCANDIKKEFITQIEELKLTEEEFKIFLGLLKKIFYEEDFQEFKKDLGFFIDPSWDL